MPRDKFEEANCRVDKVGEGNFDDYWDMAERHNEESPQRLLTATKKEFRAHLLGNQRGEREGHLAYVNGKPAGMFQKAIKEC